MSSEYEFSVNITAKNDEEFNRIRDAISMIRGVRAVLLNDFPSMPATDEYILEMYYDELGSSNTPEFVSTSWISSHLDDLGRYKVNAWVKTGYVNPTSRGGGRRATLYDKEEARKIGRLWYLTRQGIAPRAIVLEDEQQAKAG